MKGRGLRGCQLEWRLLLVGLAYLLLRCLKAWNKKRYALRMDGPAAGRRGAQALISQLHASVDARCRALAPPAPCAIRYVSLAGGGFRCLSYLGQLHLLRRCGAINASTQFSGASMGAFLGVAMAYETAGVPVWDHVMAVVLDYAIEMRRRPLWMWGLVGHIAKRMMTNHFPEDVSCINGRAHISITRLYPYPHNQLVSDFQHKSDLIECLLASMHVPFWSRGIHPVTTFRGKLVVDGGLTVNEPLPEHPSTPRARKSNIIGSIFPSAPSLTALRGSPKYMPLLHYKCKDHVAPLVQLLKPPKERLLLEELQRGWEAAAKAVVGSEGASP